MLNCQPGLPCNGEIFPNLYQKHKELSQTSAVIQIPWHLIRQINIGYLGDFNIISLLYAKKKFGDIDEYKIFSLFSQV